MMTMLEAHQKLRSIIIILTIFYSESLCDLKISPLKGEVDSVTSYNTGESTTIPNMVSFPETKVPTATIKGNYATMLETHQEIKMMVSESSSSKEAQEVSVLSRIGLKIFLGLVFGSAIIAVAAVLYCFLNGLGLLCYGFIKILAGYRPRPSEVECNANEEFDLEINPRA